MDGPFLINVLSLRDNLCREGPNRQVSWELVDPIAYNAKVSHMAQVPGIIPGEEYQTTLATVAILMFYLQSMQLF